MTTTTMITQPLEPADQPPYQPPPAPNTEPDPPLSPTPLQTSIQRQLSPVPMVSEDPTTSDQPRVDQPPAEHFPSRTPAEQEPTRIPRSVVMASTDQSPHANQPPTEPTPSPSRPAPNQTPTPRREQQREPTPPESDAESDGDDSDPAADIWSIVLGQGDQEEPLAPRAPVEGGMVGAQVWEDVPDPVGVRVGEMELDGLEVDGRSVPVVGRTTAPAPVQPPGTQQEVEAGPSRLQNNVSDVVPPPVQVFEIPEDSSSDESLDHDVAHSVIRSFLRPENGHPLQGSSSEEEEEDTPFQRDRGRRGRRMFFHSSEEEDELERDNENARRAHVPHWDVDDFSEDEDDHELMTGI